ncbi:MAG: tRNA glutamyl-Q(34) synthetase GluQRS [Sporomusaceae bacterium]|nr:tRNA glutamyl-Q(34) synthetase GluQRS [Sporomusaceae bacterium]
MGQVRGRFAPSPSGEMHLGNAWTALLAWLAVRHDNGVIILRIEDLDPDRSRPEYSEQIMADLLWLGLDWDEGPGRGGACGPYYQDERRTLYQQAIDRLAARDLLYPCFCSRAQLQAATAPHAGEREWRCPGRCRRLSPAERRQRLEQGRQPQLRLCVPDRDIAVTDLIQGRYSQNLQRDAGDFVVRRSDGVHAYQLAVVVDDALMGVNQVVRGADLLPSTPRQLYLYELLELPPPRFAHPPLLCGGDGRRLSKRQQDLSLAALRKRGVTPQSIIGYLAWKSGLMAVNEPVDAAELVAAFDFSRIGKEPVLLTAGEL